VRSQRAEFSSRYESTIRIRIAYLQLHGFRRDNSDREHTHIYLACICSRNYPSVPVRHPIAANRTSASVFLSTLYFQNVTQDLDLPKDTTIARLFNLQVTFPFHDSTSGEYQTTCSTRNSRTDGTKRARHGMYTSASQEPITAGGRCLEFSILRLGPSIRGGRPLHHTFPMLMSTSVINGLKPAMKNC